MSISVDCDGLDHYLNFAPPGTRLDDGAVQTYVRLMRTLLEIFSRHDIRATFFCIADRLENQTLLKLFREIVSCGHVIANHTYSHPDIEAIDDARHIEEIRRAHEGIVSNLGTSPVGYRAPCYYLTEAGLGELVRLGYRYDSSAYCSWVSQAAIKALSMVRRDFKAKGHSPLHALFTPNIPNLIDLGQRGQLLEFPIPVALGMAYYGTFHCMAPPLAFSLQTAWLNMTRRHAHYELHPIEVFSAEDAGRYPWVPTAAAAQRRSLTAWMERRLSRLVATRQVVTLEEICDAHRHSAHG